MGVVHDRRAIRDARGEVVGEAEGVAHLVSAELPDAREGELDRIVGSAGAGGLGPEEALEEQPVLPHAEGAEADVALEDLPRPRVRHRVPVGPSARRAVDPLDHVVTRVEGIETFGRDLDAEEAGVARRGEGLLARGACIAPRGLKAPCFRVSNGYRYASRERNKAPLDRNAIQRRLAQVKGKKARKSLWDI